jgi:hypothetical protein
MIEIIDCEQNSSDWFAARMGIPTASEFSTVMAKGRDGGASVTRAKYLRTLAADILRGFPEEESYTNVHMERGKAQEDEARQLYALIKSVAPQRVGFVKDGRKGCSPDSLVGEDGGLEIKTALGHIQIERLMLNRLPPEHKAQVQGSLWVSGRKWWDFVSYSPGLDPLIVRVERDEEYIAQLAAAVSAFNDELDAIVQSIRDRSLMKAA